MGKLMQFAGTEEQKTLVRAKTLESGNDAGEGKKEEESMITKKFREMNQRRPTLERNRVALGGGDSMGDMAPLTIKGDVVRRKTYDRLDSYYTASKPPSFAQHSPGTNDGNHLLEDSSTTPLYLTTEKPEPLATEAAGPPAGQGGRGEPVQNEDEPAYR